MTSSALHGWILCLAMGVIAAPRGRADDLPVRPFLERYCFECHDSDSPKGGLDLESSQPNLSDSDTFAEWVKIHDRVVKGEMPPARKRRPEAADLPGEAERFWGVAQGALPNGYDFMEAMLAVEGHR